VASELCTNLDGCHAPFHEALRLFRVPEGHTAVRRCIERACRSVRYGTLCVNIFHALKPVDDFECLKAAQR